MEYVILMIIVIVVFTIVSRLGSGESRKPADRPSPTGKTRKDSWPAPRRAAAARSATQRSTAQGTPASPPQQPSDSEQSDSRLGGMQDHAEERAELQEELHEQRPDDSVDYTADPTPALGAEPNPALGAEPTPASGVDPTPASRAESEPSPELAAAGGTVPDPGYSPGFRASGTADVDLGTTPRAVGATSSGYDYSSIGSVYTSTSVYTSPSALGPDSAGPAEDVDGSDAVDEAGGELGDAAERDQPAGS